MRKEDESYSYILLTRFLNFKFHSNTSFESTVTTCTEPAMDDHAIKSELKIEPGLTSFGGNTYSIEDKSRITTVIIPASTSSSYLIVLASKTQLGQH